MTVDEPVLPSTASEFSAEAEQTAGKGREHEDQGGDGTQAVTDRELLRRLGLATSSIWSALDRKVGGLCAPMRILSTVTARRQSS